MTKAFVTGASGFIGTALAEALSARGDQVACLVRKNSPLDRLKPLGVRLIEGDVTVPDSLVAAVAEADVVYHLAGLTTARNASEFFRVNEIGTRNLLEACRRRATPPVVVLVSSLSAAGPSPDGKLRTETDSPHPVSNYGRSKRAAERAAEALAAELPITVVRPPIVLGERDAVGLALFRIVAISGVHLVPGLKSGHFSIIHVADLAAALIRAAESGARLVPHKMEPGFDGDGSGNGRSSTSHNGRGSEHSDGHAQAAVDPRGYYFVAGDANPGYDELGRMIGDAVGRHRVLVVRFPAPMVWSVAMVGELMANVLRRGAYVGFDKTREALAGDWTCSSARAHEELGFAPAATLPERLRQTAEWYRRNGWL